VIKTEITSLPSAVIRKSSQTVENLSELEEFKRCKVNWTPTARYAVVKHLLNCQDHLNIKIVRRGSEIWIIKVGTDEFGQQKPMEPSYR